MQQSLAASHWRWWR